MDWKGSFNALSAYITDLEDRLRKARLMYAQWQLTEKEMMQEMLVQHDRIHALVEALSEYVERGSIDELLTNAGEGKK